MRNQNDEIKLSNEYLNDNKQVLIKEAKTKKMYSDDKKKSKLELPKDDTFVEMGIYAKNITMPEKIREKLKQEYKLKKEKRPAYIDKLDGNVKSVRINGTNYIIREIINESDGFQAIVFEHPNTHECTFTIAGSYPFNQPHLNPAEWIKDWGVNNLLIMFKHLPPQLETAIKNLDRCRKEYNITQLTGFSLGAILASMLTQFKRNKDLKTYLYNGGLPESLLCELREKYGDEISLDEPLNMVTMLSKDEFITDYYTMVRGAGIFELIDGETGHRLENHENATAESYHEIMQAGRGFADGLKGGLENPMAGNGIMYKVEMPLDFNPTVKRGIVKNVQENRIDTGLAADLFSEEEIEDFKERMEYERLPKETLKKMGEYHKRKFNEKIRETYSGDFKDLTLANFVKDGEFTFIPHDIDPKQSKPTPPSTKHPQPETDKIDLSKDEKWQSFRKIFRTFFGMPDDDGKPMGKINSTDIYNALDVMDTMKNAMHESEITQSFEQKNEFEDSMQFEFTSDEVQAKTMQNALQQGSEQIKSEVKTEILDEISRQTMFPDRDYVEDIIRDVFDSVSYRRGYKISDN